MDCMWEAGLGYLEVGEDDTGFPLAIDLRYAPGWSSKVRPYGCLVA